MAKKKDKKDKKDKESRKARMAEKSAKAQAKSDSKSKKLAKKTGEDEDDVDIDEILESFAKKQQEFLSVQITACDRPSKRINSTMISSPVHGKNEIMLFGGEYQSGTVTSFYNDFFSYSVDSDQWRKITSPNTPLPRSGHAMCVHPSGLILMFGGEFSSPKQSTFYHYGDTWVVDAQSKEWSKVEYKKGPIGRSGHRLTYWKNYVLMFGGFRDLSTAVYLNDLWAFDITSYKWHQVEFSNNQQVPDPRSGHSFLPTTDGAVIWGGYSKVKAKKGLQTGKVHTDAWILKMKSDLKGVHWERRKKTNFAPSPRVGCSMVHHKGRGVLFGGVYDVEETEESLDSTFFNNLYAYQIEMNKWFGLNLRSGRKRVVKIKERPNRLAELEDNLSQLLSETSQEKPIDDPDQSTSPEPEPSPSTNYKIVNSLPHPRFNATTAVVDDTLFIFGGVWERGEREFNLDSFYSVDLGKLDGLRVYWEDLSELDQDDEDEEEDDDDDEDDEDENDDDDEDDEDGEIDDNSELVNDPVEEEQELEEPEGQPDTRPWLPHPKAFETLRAFYQRTSAEFLEWALKTDHESRGKDLKRTAFEICEERWWERREEVRMAEDQFEEMGGVSDVVERDARVGKRR